MKLENLNIEELVELRTKMILENKSTDSINRLIDRKEREYASYLTEDTSATGGPAGAAASGGAGAYSGGVAMANAATPGMGAVVSAQPSSLAGSTIGSDWSNNGGKEGSGDISNPFPVGGKNFMYQKTPGEMGKDHGARTGKKSRVKKQDLKALKDIFAKKQDFTATKQKKVMNFDDFQKQNLSQVTRVKN